MGQTEDAALGQAAARILVAAATTLLGNGVVAALGDDARFVVVGSARDEREFVWRVVAERPDVALLDIELLNPAIANGLFPGAADGPRLIVLAVGDGEEEISACARAGATEIVRRHADRDELLAAIARALAGDSRLSSLQSAMAPRVPSPSGADAEPAQLTPREREILALIEAGSTNKAIARELGCSESTVKNHVHSLLAKLGVSRRTEAARIARTELALSGDRADAP